MKSSIATAFAPARPDVTRLVVVSHVIHYLHRGAIYAYGPYAREIDIWADLFEAVVIAAPCRQEEPPGDALPFERRNITVAPQIEAGGDHWSAKIRQALLLPVMLARLAATLFRAQAIHVRCPGNLGLLGVLLAPVFSKYRIAKYAGQWNGYAGEPLAVALQRRLLASRWWGAPVTVYGEWPQQPPHVVPFFTSMMSRAQVQAAAAAARDRSMHTPLRVLFMGALARRKRVDALIEAVALARRGGVAIELTLVGAGPEREHLQSLVTKYGLDATTTFTGGLPFGEGLRYYEWADCLVLPSAHSEGWPKAVAEAMSFGALAIAVDHGQLSSMLDRRGVLLPTGHASEIAAALMAAARDPERHLELARHGARWAAAFSLEGLREALRALLAAHWSGAAAPAGGALRGGRG